MNQWQDLAAALNRTMASHVPEWTNRNDADPGMTVLEVMAYLAEELASRGRVEGGSAAAGRIIAALERIGTVQPQASVALAERWSGTKRPNYFEGKILGADDLTEEQNYFLGKHRHHLRSLHGMGIVHGLGVSADEQGQTIAIAPGLAIDELGRDVQLSEHVTLVVPPDTSFPVVVIAEYAERLVDPVAVVVDDEAAKPSRIEEGCRIAIANPPGKSGVALARLIDEQNAWRVDPTFVPPRAR